MKKPIFTAVAALTIVSALTAARAQETKPATVGATMTAHVLLTAADVKWSDGPASLPPGAKLAVIEGDPKAPNALFTIRLKLPAGYKVMPHSHPADEHVTVIAGAFWMGMGDKHDPSRMKKLPAGGFAVMPAGHHHFAMTKAETVVQVHGVGPWGINYVNLLDDPRAQTKK